MGGKFCKQWKKSKSNAAVGSVLDQVISQADGAENQCLLYRIANYKKGGELIDVYNSGGQAEVEKLIREQFGVLMYCDGRGQKINRAEYLRWKYRDCEQVMVPIEASLSPHDPLGRWQDHEACWQMRYRGSLGESLLHVLIICDTKLHTRLARTLLRCFPRLSLDVVEGEEYLGASALHLAIAYFNNELVQDLIEAGANVNQRAIGSFFLPRDQQKAKPAKHTDYEGLAYLGEYPLAWAACCANESVYNLLLDSGADPDLKDSFGNMILHMVVVCDKLDMFGYALRHPKLPASNGILNNNGLTPLTLACTLGRAEVFREMLELSAREFWRYSNITCSAYPLNALDTLLPDGRTNWNSALFIILNGTKEEHLDMLDGGIIQRLLEEKWKTFARKQFLKRLLILFIHLICLSVAVYLRPAERSSPVVEGAKPGTSSNDNDDDPEDVRTIVRYVFEVATILGVLSYVIFQQGDEIKNQGLGAFLKQLTRAPAKAIFLVSNLLILACIPFRFIGDRNTEEAILVFAVPGSWFLLMFFAGAVRLTGPFVTMIYSMITGDMLTFGIIYTIVLFGFSQSFFFLYKGYPNVKSTLYSSYPSTWMALFQITLGDYNYSELSNTTYPNLSKAVFAIFMVFVPILLLNMLIAMMGNTYAHVIEQSEKEWMKQWAKIVVALERAVSQTDLHRFLEEYSIALGPSDDPRYEQRGVMVIKSKSKTRAKQRKGAVANWKRVGKVTISALRNRNMTGEELRRIMWGRESICTPTKGPIIIPSSDVDGPSLAGGFGGALTAALDVMAFTHDLDLSGAQGLQLAGAGTIITPKDATKLSAKDNAPVSGHSKAVDKLQGILTATGAFVIAGREGLDPLRELILMADSRHSSSKTWIDSVNTLAKAAANMEELPQAVIQSVKAADTKNAMADLFGIPAREDALPSKDGQVQLPPTIDPSDSDGFGEPPVLGRGSLLRRAKSAANRNSARSADRIPLFSTMESDTETDGKFGIENLAISVVTKNFLDYETERIKDIKDSTGNIYVTTSGGTDLQQMYKHVNMERVRPSNIENAILGPRERANYPTTDEVRQANESRFEAASPYFQQSLRKGKQRPKTRPKTARNNRISPMDSSGNRRTGPYSAPTLGPTASPPDPLEPWATRSLADMNTILAWQCDNDFSNTDSPP